MSGFEIAGIIVSAVPVVTRVIKHFGTQRNAPRQVERLSRMLAELQDERLSQTAMPAEQRHIHDMVNRCTDILEREETARRKGGLWKFFWSAEAEKMLKEHNDELERELDRLQRRVQMYGVVSPTPPPIAPSSPTEAAVTREVQTPSPYLEPKEFGRSPSTASAVSAPGSLAPNYRSRRRGSVAAVNLPTTLCLQNPYGQRIGEKLKLQSLTILERDDTWRRIQYAGRGAGGVQVRITHRIPRGNIWFEDEDLDDRSVSFIQPHDFTIENAEGYKVYRAYSLYEFGSVEHREQFLVHVRERQLLGRYLADKIWERGELIAQQKVVRLWKKTASRESQKTTLSFIGRDQKPYERPLVDFRRSPTLRGDRVELLDVVGGTKTTLEFRPPPKQKQPKSKWGFGSKSKSSASPTPESGTVESDAARFKAAFEANHPSTSTWTPLTLSPTGLEPPDFNDFAPRISTPSPCLPELVPSSSRAPTLSTLSIASAPYSFVPDEMDLPVSPKTRSTMSDKDTR